MKKSSLSGAVAAAIVGAAGLASLAHAQSVSSRLFLNPDGLGQVLVYPYYTVNKNQATLISVVNTTDQVKAVKVRFLEGRNSKEVLDFNLYLSPFDVWTGAITDQGNNTGPGVLNTADTSCTAPAIPAAGVSFRNFAYAQGSGKDDGPQTLDRTREGHIEIIEMGSVVDNGDVLDRVVEETSGGTVIARALATAATHTSAGEPVNCNALRAALSTGGVWASQSLNIDMLPPSGGLFGAANIVDVALGTNLSYNADAIGGFYQNQGTDSANRWNTLHTLTGSVLPSLAQAATNATGADAEVFVDGTSVVLPFAGRGAAPVSAVFMYDAIYNEFVTSESLGANSEWVITFPTKRLHIDRATFVPGSTSNARNHQVLQNLRPFTDWVDSTNDGRVYDTAGSCEVISVSYFDREEGPFGTPTDIDFSPPPVTSTPGLNLCYEAQVVSFNQPTTGEANDASKVLGSRYARNLNLVGAPTGWARIKLGTDSLTDPFGLGNSRGNYLPDGAILGNGESKTGLRLYGLPATGFWALQVARTDGGSALANYAGTWRHRGSRRVGAYSETISQNGFVSGCTFINASGVTEACPNFRTAVSSGSAL